MPRLREIPRDEAPPSVIEAYERMFGERDPVAEPGTATGTSGNWWTVWAQSPVFLNHAREAFALFGAEERKVTPHQRELGLTRAGFAVGSQFVFSQHCKAARRAGISEEKIAALPAWPVSDVFSAEERAILAYTDALILEQGRVQDGVFAALKAHLSDEAVMELTYMVATYGMHATISRALRLEYDDVDERVVEVPGPAEGASYDVLGQIGR